MRPVTLRELLSLAAPAALSAILNNSYRTLDQYAVQDLGLPAQAAVGSCVFVYIGMFAMVALMSAGVGPLVARAVGAGDDALARRATGNALVGVALISLGLGALLWPAAPAVAGLLGLSGEPAAQAAIYLRGLALVGLPMAVEPVLDAVFIAMGRARVALGLQVVATALKLALNPLLIHTAGLGLLGASLAGGLSRGAASSIGLVLLARAIGLRWADLRLDDTFRRVARIGFPITFNTAAYAAVYWALLKVAISPLGPEVNAALGVGFSALEGFTWPLFLGISLGVASLVGRHLGAGQPEQARRAARLGLPVSLTAGLGAALAFWFGAEPLCGAFTSDPAVLAQAVIYARILAFSQVFVALEALSEGVLEGAGDTATVFRWSAPLNALRVPLGWALALPLGWGAAGVWWAINLTTWLKCAGKGLAAWRGDWVHARV